jgi:hypothetical protein
MVYPELSLKVRPDDMMREASRIGKKQQEYEDHRELSLEFGNLYCREPAWPYDVMPIVGGNMFSARCVGKAA